MKEENEDQYNTICDEPKEKTPRLRDVFIERVKNGYILIEDEDIYNRRNEANVRVRQVFETKDSLFEFLRNNF